MADEAKPLSDDERAELEALRAERAAREERERAARERAELEALRAEHEAATSAPTQKQPARTQREATEEDLRIREARERGAKLMEPDDDLRMPLGQKITLAVLAAAVIIVIVMNLLVG